MTLLRTIIIAAALAIAASAQPSLAAPLNLAPVEEWRLLRNEASCELIRRFGTGDQQVTLLLELSGPEGHFNFSVYGRHFAKVGTKVVEVRFGPNEDSTRRAYLFGKDARGMPFLIMHGVPLAPPAAGTETTSDGWLGAAREAAISEVTLSRAFPRPVRLELGPMGENFRQIRECAVELAARLENGPLPGGFGSLPEPIGDSSTWLTSADYPPGLVFRDVEGVVRFRLVVGRAGKPLACHIDAGTNSVAFNDTVCALLMRRAKFTPATDPGGKPVAAYHRTSIRFTIG